MKHFVIMQSRKGRHAFACPYNSCTRHTPQQQDFAHAYDIKTAPLLLRLLIPPCYSVIQFHVQSCYNNYRCNNHTTDKHWHSFSHHGPNQAIVSRAHRQHDQEYPKRTVKIRGLVSGKCWIFRRHWSVRGCCCCTVGRNGRCRVPCCLCNLPMHEGNLGGYHSAVRLRQGNCNCLPPSCRMYHDDQPNYNFMQGRYRLRAIG
jgi:hypothetical protein